MTIDNESDRNIVELTFLVSLISLVSLCEIENDFLCCDVASKMKCPRAYIDLSQQFLMVRASLNSCKLLYKKA